MGPATHADLTLRWPDGGTEEIREVGADQLVVIREGVGVVRTARFGTRAPATPHGRQRPPVAQVSATVVAPAQASGSETV
jgi:hypothetical protein